MKSQAGMTLLEVLVALLIFATAALSLGESLSLAGRYSQQASDLTGASQLARNLLLEQARTGGLLAEEGEAQMGGRHYRWRLSGLNQGPPTLYISLADAPDGMVFSMELPGSE